MTYLSTIENVEAAANLLGEMVADGRLSILYRLSESEATVEALAAEFGMDPPTLDPHLIRLHELGLVRKTVDAQTVHYRCDDAAVNNLLRVIAEIYVGGRTR